MGARVSVPEELVENNVGYLPSILGKGLSVQIDDYVRRERLSYYPALDYFRDRPDAVDPALLALVDEVAAFCIRYATREFRRRLARAFSNVQVQQSQSTAYTLPRVLRRANDAERALARHFAPNQVKLELILSSVEREIFEGFEKLAARKVTGWAKAPFASFELFPARRLDV